MKTNTLSKIFLFISLSICPLIQSQDNEVVIKTSDSLKIKRVNLGLKLGIPNVVGGSAELILPILGNRIAPFIDYSGFNIDTNDLATNFSYLEYGASLYFNKKGNGFFIALGQGQFNTNLTFYDLEFSEDGQSTTGTASTDFNFNTTNLKLGIKTGGSFYFRFEVGYGFGNIPESVDFTATASGITESFSEEIPPIPGVSSQGTIIGNIGFGISF